MKRFLSFMLVLIFAFCSLTACKDKEPEKTVGEETTAVQETPVSVNEFEFDTSGVTAEKQITVDGNKALTAENTTYDGLGMVSANNSSRLLTDYRREHPDIYNELIEYMFGSEGLNLSIIKIEMGADVNSSSGTEPAVKRYEDEEADVTRGAGYQLAADAQKCNPDLYVDLLNWGIPNWVANASDPYAATYKWYKETIDALYDTYGLKVTHVTATRNERDIDTEWVKYLADKLENETDERYDYGEIKIVAGEEVCTWGIADEMLKDEDLLNAVDVITSHYTSFTSSNVKLLQEEYGKEVWFSDGSSPMGNSKEIYKYGGNGSGISGINGMLDIATRITQAMTEGMTMYEFQPTISAYYSGVTYFPKQLITANEPWSGAYTLDTGYYMSLHFSRFIKKGWNYIDDACFGDGSAGGDGHAIVNSTYNYITCMDPESKDYSMVLVNNSEKTIKYDITVKNAGSEDSVLYAWETRGPDCDDDDYFANYFKLLGAVKASEDSEQNKVYTVVLKPYSIMTLSTLNVEQVEYKDRSDESKLLELPYSDDFEYTDFDSSYLEAHGYTPRYATDLGGAFEVVSTDNGNVLMQKITYDNKPVEWGSSSSPITNLGDDRWQNYTASVDVLFTDKVTDDTKANYTGIGVRYILADSNQSGYWCKLYDSGKWELMRDNSSVESGTISDFDSTEWHNIQITAIENVISCSIDGVELTTWTDEKGVINSGRIALYISFENNCFDNLKAEKAGDGEYYITRLDNLNEAITYSAGSTDENGEGWFFDNMCTYKNFNRTLSTGEVGDTVSVKFNGTEVAIIGPSKEATIKVEIDGTTVEENYVCPKGSQRKACYRISGLEDGEHTITVTVVSGTFNVDAVEYR